MQKHRYKVSFLLTSLLYIVPVATYLYFLQKQLFSVSEPREDAIELSLSQFVPEAPPIQSETPVQKEQVVEEKPEPVEEKHEEIEPLLPEPEKTEPIEEEVPVVKPVPVKKEKPKQIQKKVPKKKKYKKKIQHKRKISGGGTPHYSAAQKNRFLAMIRKKINQAKSYPRIARKKGMQGTVKVQFVILKNGHLGKIVLSGPKIFHTSAKKAVQSAFPVNVKQATLSLPATVNLSLRYKLR